jgi:uncharacterized protein (TIGR02145 family)
MTNKSAITAICHTQPITIGNTMNKLAKFAQAAVLGLAITFTLNACEEKEKKQTASEAEAAAATQQPTQEAAQEAAAPPPTQETAEKCPNAVTGNGTLTCGGQTYKTVKIGNQTWMAENLNFEAKGSKCYDNKPDNCKKYGRLYDWKTANEACPKGWKLPSNAEWQTLADFAGGDDKAGKKLKASSGWNDNGNGVDAVGFSALPGGFGNTEEGESKVGELGSWWISSEGGSYNAFREIMSDTFDRNYDDLDGFLRSVRCIQN